MKNIEDEAFKKILKLIESVAHVGVDFGFGKHELSDDDIKSARDLHEYLSKI